MSGWRPLLPIAGALALLLSLVVPLAGLLATATVWWVRRRGAAGAV